jgi:catechol 2,3-dioxygenase-like lactoylglutathione lyase family enzyme
MLSSEKLVAFVSTTNADHARAFYRDKLGLRLVSEDGFALVFDSGGAPLRIALTKEVKPVQGTVLGWDVKDIRTTVTDLKKVGIVCEIFGFFKQDDLGIWTAPDGTQVAWFKDPEGNVLGIAQHA